jgi:type VI secretion system protein
MLPLVLEVEDLQSGRSASYTFPRSPVRLGRLPLNDLELDFPFVSQWHGMIRVDDRGIYYVDVGSTNGSFVNGKPATKGQEIALLPSSEIVIGTLRLCVAQTPKAPSIQAPIYQSQFARATGFTTTPGNESATLFDTAFPPPPENSVSCTAGNSSASQARRPTIPNTPPTARSSSSRPQYRASSNKGVRLPQKRYDSVSKRAAATIPTDSGLISNFSKAYLPNVKEPLTGAEQEQFLNRMGIVLETFTQASLEMRKGLEKFGEDLGVRSIQGESPLFSATKLEDILAYLLDWRLSDDELRRDLMRLYASFMVHQVALLNGINQGTRALVSKFGPDTIEKEVSSIGPLRTMSCWKAYCERYKELMNDETAFSQELLGKEFAHAYATTAGATTSADANKMSLAEKSPKSQ